MGLIKLYWKIIPVNKRRHCLFKESCSNYIYRLTQTDGFCSGIKALVERYMQCRPGYTLVINEETKTCELRLKNGKIIGNDKIALNLFPSEEFCPF